MEDASIENTGTFTDYMVKDGQVARIVTEATAEISKNACLQYTFFKKADHIALVDIEIETGRFHQIRCQMSHHGMPLLGDAKYGSSQSVSLSQNLGVRNVALCANRIAFKHPVTGKVMQFEVEPANPAFGKFL